MKRDCKKFNERKSLSRKDLKAHKEIKSKVNKIIT